MGADIFTQSPHHKEASYGLESLTLSLQRSASYRNQSIGFQGNSVDLFLYDRDLRHESVKSPL